MGAVAACHQRGAADRSVRLGLDLDPELIVLCVDSEMQLSQTLLLQEAKNSLSVKIVEPRCDGGSTETRGRV